jgi:pimeloyl-ACP methyl ester carboxylesterase
MRGARRFREQKWLLDIVIATVGLDWDQLRMAITTAPVGFEAIGDWSVVAGRAKRFDEITPAFRDGAERRESKAQEAQSRGDLVSARESYLVAALYYGMAQWPIDEASALNRELDAKKIANFTNYAALANYRIERVEIPMGDKAVPGWLHFPLAGEPPYPVVISLPGMDTFKETLVWSYGDKLLERGLAVLAIDGPGQYEARLRGVTITADNFADAGRACVAWIDGNAALDSERIGVFGRSFGSYAATVLANAVADRLRGVAVGLLCHEPGFRTIFEEASPTFKNRFMFMAGYDDEATFDRFIQDFDLRSRVAGLTCPYFALGGSLDELAPIKNSYDLMPRIPGLVQLVIYENERHAPGRMPSAQFGPHWYSMMADWLAARVRDRKSQERRLHLYVKSSGALEERAFPSAQ